MTVPTGIPSPSQPITTTDPSGNGVLTRIWWRYLNALKSVGTTATELVVKGSAFLNAATVSSGGTISSPPLAAGSLIGNPGSVAAQAAALPVGASLSISGGAAEIAPIAGLSLLGNAGTATAVPSSVPIGAGLAVSGGSLAVDTSFPLDPDTQTWVATIRDSRSDYGRVDRKATDALTMALLPPRAPGAAPVTVAASSLFGNSGSVAAAGSSVAVGANLLLSGGTLSASGSIAASITVAAHSLFGNPSGTSALGSSVGIGSGLSLSAGGTLSATGVSAIAAGAGLSGGTITSSGTIALAAIAAGEILGNAGTVSGVPSGIAIGANLSLSASGTLSAVPGTIATTGPGITGGPISGSGTLAVQWNAGTVNAVSGGTVSGGTLTIAAGIPTLTAGFGIQANGTTGGTLTASGTLGALQQFSEWPFTQGTYSGSGGVDAIKGNFFQVSETVSIARVLANLGTWVAGGTYAAWIAQGSSAAPGASSTVSAVTSLGTYVPSSTYGGSHSFPASPPVALSPGNYYALLIGRTDSTTLFATPAWMSSLLASYSWSDDLIGCVNIANTTISVGDAMPVQAQVSPTVYTYLIGASGYRGT